MSAQEPSKDPKFDAFLQRLEARRHEVLPVGLEEYRMHTVTNFDVKERPIYEQSIAQHHGGKLYGGNVVLKVLIGHAQAANGGFLDADQYATLVAYYKPAPMDKSDPLYDEMRGLSEQVEKLQKQLHDQLEQMGEDMSRFEPLSLKQKDFTYDLSAFWSTFEQVKKAHQFKRGPVR